MSRTTVASPGVDSSHPAPPASGAISRAQIEIVCARAVSGFGLIFGVQAIPTMIGQWHQFAQPWALIVVIVVFGSLLFVLAASMVNRIVNQAMLCVAVVYLTAVVTWPATMADSAAHAPDRPWLWYLCTVATAAAVVALPVWQAAAYTVIAPLAYGIIRVLPSGGGASWRLAAVDVTYAVILGGVVLVIVTMLRQAASDVDRAQQTALKQYAAAVRQHATDAERVSVDALVHDSVLTALLAAASAGSEETKLLAVRMARNAIGHLNTTEESIAAAPNGVTEVSVSRLGSRVRAAARVLSVPFAVSVRRLGDGSIPEPVAEAVYSATVQAMVNSMQHAGGAGIRRQIRLLGTEADGVAGPGLVVEVADSGSGFDPDTVPADRLGLRISIVDRVAQAGGAATVRSHPGVGTTVVIQWPAPGTPR
ncbi:MAG: ATP-binding protein [Microbacteriaceae bacterium]